MNILLIAGGWSSERDVSLAGASVILAAIERLGHKVTMFDPSTGLQELGRAAHGQDFAFINLHGAPGEDGLIQAMLENLGLPYQGSGPAASMLALNKAAAKMFFRRGGLPTADWTLLTSRPEHGWMPMLPFPVFIKDNTGGSSLHMEKVDSPKDLKAALDRLFAEDREYIVEPALFGLELTCAVLGELDECGREKAVALPPILIKAKGKDGLFDYTSKYTPGGAEEICPAPISAPDTERIKDLSLKAHSLLGLSGYSRSDFILTKDGPILLEVNTLPGMTSTSLLPQEAAAAGLDFGALVERLIRLGLARFGKSGSAG